jgi:hypothetical protein
VPRKILGPVRTGGLRSGVARLVPASPRRAGAAEASGTGARVPAPSIPGGVAVVAGWSAQAQTSNKETLTHKRVKVAEIDR